jgi:bifunctional non-homologous end joining protein LigD
MARKVSPGRSAAKSASRRLAALPLPAFRAVQLASLVDTVPTGICWIHEMKYDGYRLEVAIGGGEARAYTRSGLDWSDRFAGILEEAAALKVRSALLDGEAVVLDEQGRSSFQSLQNALKGAPAAIDYIAFDLLELDGEDLTGLPLIERKTRLKGLLPDGRQRIRYSEHIKGKGETLLRSFCEAGLEGVISKQADGRYAGSRSGGWLKTKCIKRQEFIILGWTTSDKARGFRSLILGVHDNGALRYAGKVGTGFTMDEIDRLLEVMEPLEQKTPTVEAPRAEVRGAHWLKPRLVAEIAFTEMTQEGTLRHPSYLGLREDKKPEAVVLEVEAPVENAQASPVSTVAISNRDRVIFPESKITKGELADYYATLAPAMLPWVGSRPVSLVRCPQGRAKKCFFKNMMPAALARTSSMSASWKRTATRSPTSFSTRQRACSPAYRWARSSSMVGVPGSRMSRKPTVWCSTSILTRASISRRCARPPFSFATSSKPSALRPSRW